MKYFKYLGLSLLLFSSFFGMGQTVTSVSSTAADGSYKVGDALQITITFSENVTVNGTPQLTLETGTSDAVVKYFSGSGSNTLNFNYNISSDHITTDLDYQAINSLKPGLPTFGVLDNINTGGHANNIAIKGNYAYMANGSSGLYIVNISDPANPGTAVSRNTNRDERNPGYRYSHSADVAIKGNYAFIADLSAGLAIIDISNPTNPGNPSYVDINCSYNGNVVEGYAQAVAIKDNYVYVGFSGNGDSGLAIIDCIPSAKSELIRVKL